MEVTLVLLQRMNRFIILINMKYLGKDRRLRIEKDVRWIIALHSQIEYQILAILGDIYGIFKMLDVINRYKSKLDLPSIWNMNYIYQCSISCFVISNAIKQERTWHSQERT